MATTNLDDLLNQAESQETSNDEWVLDFKYETKDFYVDEHGAVEIRNKTIGNMSNHISVKGESYSQYIEFKMNRFYDGVDLTTMALAIYYEIPNVGSDESRPINVYYNEREIKFGWAVPLEITQNNLTITLCIYFRGKLPDGKEYVLKTKPANYLIDNGLDFGSGIIQPTENWYLNFVLEMDSKVQIATDAAVQSLNSSNVAKESESVVLQSKQVVEEKSDDVNKKYAEVQTMHSETKNYRDEAGRYRDEAKTDVGKLSSEIDDLRLINCKWIHGGYKGSNGDNLIFDTNNKLRVISDSFIPLKKGDRVVINNTISTQIGMITKLDTQGVIVEEGHWETPIHDYTAENDMQIVIIWKNKDNSEITPNEVGTAYISKSKREEINNMSSVVDNLAQVIPLYNLNNFTSVKNGYDLNTKGAEVPNTSAPYYFITSKMYIKKGKYVIFSNGGKFRVNRVLFYENNNEITMYTNDGTPISGTRHDERDNVYAWDFVITKDGYIAISFYTGYSSITPNVDEIGVVSFDNYISNSFMPVGNRIASDKLVIHTKKWLEGKKWYALGDSLTAQGNYTSYIENTTGAICTNYGVGGSTLCDYDGKHSNAMVYRFSQMADIVPDFITVMGGTNDCYYSKIGSVGDTGNDTVAGSIYTIYKGLQEKYPNIPILWCIFPRRMDNKWSEYYNIIKETLNYWSIPYVDVYKECGFNTWNQSIYFNENDQVHINSDGGKVVGRLIIDGLHKVLDY